MRKSFILVNERHFPTYVTHALGAVKYYYVGLVLDVGHIELLEVATEKNADSEEDK